jgi:tetratricopeptide (TPR) repeat protein
LYAYCQQGRYSKAEELLGIMKKSMTESTYDDKLRPNYYANNWAMMAATFIMETERWDLLDKLLPPGSSAVEPAAESHGTGAAMPAPQNATVRQSSAAQVVPLFMRGFVSAVKGNSDAEAVIAAIRARRASGPAAGSYGGAARMMPIRLLEVEAALASSRGKHDDAIDAMKKATKAEEELGPPSGPPPLIKPSHELSGEILLKANRPKEALEEFGAALSRQPNRARSLIGAARAAARSGNPKKAAEFYARFAEQWQQADANLPELVEARDYLKQARAQ